nr:sigma-70 family RNA polymerase sigma factor [Pedobacter sp. ASV19]
MEVKNIGQHIEDWVNGNEMAFKFVFDYYYPRLLATSLKLVDKQEDAEEMVMNALLKIWQHKHRINDIQHLKKYLFGILRQEISGLSRKKVLLTEDIEDVPLQNLGTVDHPEFSLKDLQFHYRMALEKLSPKQREIFLLSRGSEMSQQEIADSTGLSVNTVNNHISASLKIIRKEMQDYPDVIVLILISGTVTTTFLFS